MTEIVKDGDKGSQSKDSGYPIYFTCRKCGCEFKESSKNVTFIDERSFNTAKTNCPQCGKKVKKDI